MQPLLLVFLTLFLFHLTRQPKCTNPQDPEHLQGEHKKSPYWSDYVIIQYLHSFYVVIS